jgi:hypothetical protein
MAKKKITAVEDKAVGTVELSDDQIAEMVYGKMTEMIKALTTARKFGLVTNFNLGMNDAGEYTCTSFSVVKEIKKIG